MKFFKGLTLLGMFAGGFVMDIYGANPIACVQYPLYDDGMSCLFAADYYDDNIPAICSNEPQIVYQWGLVTDPSPEQCPDCQSAKFVLAKEKSSDARERSSDAKKLLPCGKLKKPLPANHRFHDKLHPIQGKKANGMPTDGKWDPKPGIKVLSSQWVLVQAATVAIPVKLYVIQIDTTNVTLPADAVPHKHKLMVRQIGFEMKSLPPGVTAPLLNPNRWSGNPDCLTTCEVKVDDETEPYFVTTHTDVFEMP